MAEASVSKLSLHCMQLRQVCTPRLIIIMTWRTAVATSILRLAWQEKISPWPSIASHLRYFHLHCSQGRSPSTFQTIIFWLCSTIRYIKLGWFSALWSPWLLNLTYDLPSTKTLASSLIAVLEQKQTTYSWPRHVPFSGYLALDPTLESHCHIFYICHLNISGVWGKDSGNFFFWLPPLIDFGTSILLPSRWCYIGKSRYNQDTYMKNNDKAWDHHINFELKNAFSHRKNTTQNCYWIWSFLFRTNQMRCFYLLLNI